MIINFKENKKLAMNKITTFLTCILKMTYKRWQKDQLWNNSQGPVARSLVSANRWLRGIKLYRFPWYLTLVSTNHASSNPGQSARNKHQHLYRVTWLVCCVFTSVLIVLVFAAFSPVLFEHLGLQLFLFDNAWCGAILPLVWFLFFFFICPFYLILRADWLTEVY